MSCTKSEILAAMTAIVEATMTSCKSDFYTYDRTAILEPNFQFPVIWVVGKAGTILINLGQYEERFETSEATRYGYLTYGLPCAYYFDSIDHKDRKWYIITEDGLQLIDQERAKAFTKDHVARIVQKWIENNGPLPTQLKVPVKLHGISISKLKELIQECRDHNDDSLLMVLKRFHNYQRVAENHRVDVYYHEGDKEFWFVNRVNEGNCLSGAIVFHGWPETGYQTNGSIQIDPEYGWSSHT